MTKPRSFALDHRRPYAVYFSLRGGRWRDAHREPLAWSKPEGSYRIATYNIAHGRARALSHLWVHPETTLENLHGIGALTRSLDADFVAFQEVDLDAFWSGNADHARIISEVSALPHAYTGHNVRYTSPVTFIYGNATLARHEAVHVEHNRFGDCRLGGKGYLQTDFAVGDQRLTVLNVHLEHKSPRRRLAQLERLEPIVKDVPHALIALGDFNSTMRADGPLHRFAARCGLHHFDADGGLGRSFRKLGTRFRIDFIFGNEWVHFGESRIIDSPHSDHLPVCSDFTILPAGAN